MEYISVMIAGIGVAVSMYFSNKNLKASIVEQEHRRESEMLKRQEAVVIKAEKDAERHTQIMEKLGVLMDRTESNNREIAEIKGEVKKLNDTQISNVQSIKSAHEKIDEMQKQISKLHKEHRERCEKCG